MWRASWWWHENCKHSSRLNLVASRFRYAVSTSQDASATIALAYAGRGWKVFPVKHDKTPYTNRGYKSATTDAAQIQAWWASHPNANIGVACEPSQLLVLDVDPRNGGDRTLAHLQSEYGELPYGPRSRTGGGGWHYFYIAPDFRPVLGDGVDVKYHGYVVLPYSLYESGRRYEWLVAPDEAELPTVPDAWRPLLLTRAPTTTATTKTRSLAYREGGPIPQGSRDNTLTQIAGAMRRASVSPQGIEAALRVENADRCQATAIRCRPAQNRVKRRTVSYRAGLDARPGDVRQQNRSRAQ